MLSLRLRVSVNTIVNTRAAVSSGLIVLGDSDGTVVVEDGGIMITDVAESVPAGLSGLMMYALANDITGATQGDSVLSVPSHFGAPLTLAQTQAAKAPTIALNEVNGHSAFYFNGSQQYPTAFYFDTGKTMDDFTNEGLTIMAVIKATGNFMWDGSILGDTGNYTWLMAHTTRAANSNPGLFSTFFTDVPAGYFILTATKSNINPSQSCTLKIYMNETLKAEETNTNSSDDNTNNILCVGTTFDTSGNTYYKGYIERFIVYNRVLTDEERNSEITTIKSELAL